MSKKCNAQSVLRRLVWLPAFMAAAFVLANSAVQPVAASPTKGIVISSKPPKCAPGFKPQNIRGKSYRCVSQKPVCSKNYQVWAPAYKKASKRFEYVCALPEG